jgi:MerR family transcriptional regulator, light-induced transcriptional regulator
MNNLLKNEDHLSIGELSKQTGIGVHSLRVWEKRYGAPHPERLPSGHRRYPKGEVQRVRAVARALESGYRASKVVTGTMEELQGLLGVKNLTTSKPLQPDTNSGQVSRKLTLSKWIDAVHRFDDFTLTQGFYDEWGKNGPLRFITNFAAPLIYQLGEDWENGELTVSQEHFASERLEQFLSGMWRRMNEKKEGPVILVTTLPGDPHRLGIQMCAAVTALTEARVIYLGPDTPTDEIIWAVKQCQADVLSISVSPTMDPVEVKNHLKMIKDNMKETVDLVVGGNGAPEGIPGTNRFISFAEYLDWLNKRNFTKKFILKTRTR